MAKDQYVILSVPGGDAGLGGPNAKPTAKQKSEAKVEVAEMEEDAARAVSRSPEVVGVMRAGLRLKLIKPADEPGAAAQDEGDLWGLVAVKALQSNRTGKGQRVAVLDTGCDVNHEAFNELKTKNRIVSRNFTSADTEDVRDDDGHGTHCAGTICGGAVGGKRIGVAPGVDRLIVGKVLGEDGGGNDTIMQAIIWAMQQGAGVISMSLGIDFPGWVQDLHERRGLPLPQATSMALKDYRDTINAFGKLSDLLRLQNVLVVAASGNESDRPRYTIDKSPPAASDHILSVAAVGKGGAEFGIARFSNTGVDVAGPGVGIVSAQAGGGLLTLSGTSMATPHVAGVAALWGEQLAEGGEVSHQALKAKLIGSARELQLSRGDVGAGMVQAPTA